MRGVKLNHAYFILRQSTTEAGFVGPLVGHFVEFCANVATGPDEPNWILVVECVEFANEVEILDGAGFFVPTIGGPAVGPFGKDVEPKFRISVDFATFVPSVFNGSDEGGAFHANISSVLVATECDWLAFAVYNFNYSEATVARIWLSAAVGP